MFCRLFICSLFVGIAGIAWADESLPLPRILTTPPKKKIVESKYLLVKPGTLPIVVSAPHGGRTPIPGIETRKGDGIDKFAIVRDERTDQLAEHFCDEIEKRLHGRPHLILARFERKQLDVNRVPSSSYENDEAKDYYDAYYQAINDAVTTVNRKYKQGLFLDIHGQGMSKDSIYRGTLNLKSVTLLKERFGMPAIIGPKSIFGQLNKKGYDVLPANQLNLREDRYTGGNLLSTFGSHYVTGLDAFQLEFGTNFRTKERVEKTAEDLAEVVSVFAKEYLPK
jgi:N-formylglutamate amidohydrolase